MESQTKILFLHGNPGSPNDFDELINALVLEPDSVILPAIMFYDDPVANTISFIDHELKNNASEIIMIGYSWGAYLACKILEQESFCKKYKIKEVAFISPYLLPQQKLSLISKMVMSIPFIKNRIAAGIAKKRHENFIHNILDKGEHALLIRKKQETFLKDANNWLQAIRLKKFQEQHPISGIFTQPNISFIALDDKAMDPKKQLDILQRTFPNNTVKQFQTGNHGLLWTNTESIAKHLNHLLFKK